MDWLEGHFLEVGGFPRPYWAGVYADVKQYHVDANQFELWCDIARSWLNRLVSSLPSTYTLHESGMFMLVTSAPKNYVTDFQARIERTFNQITGTLQGIAADDGLGKYAIILFDDIELFYAYRSYFYGNKEVCEIDSGGYIDRGYRHFVFLRQELSYMHKMIAHEMTHALLCHLSIPAWLNEGMAVNTKDLIARSTPPVMDNEMRARHRLYWGAEGIQAFWSGGSFYRSGEGQELSYHLAQLAVHSLSQDYNAFVQFANKAHHTDGGETAIKEVYRDNLGNLIAQYLGEGDWAPKPRSWSDIYTGKTTGTDFAKRRG